MRAGLTNNGTIALLRRPHRRSGRAHEQQRRQDDRHRAPATATFYDAVTNNAGSEFRVSTNSTATFLGPVTGLSQFTGAGTVIFESSAAMGAIDRGGTTVVDAGGTLTAQHVRDARLIVDGLASIPANGTSAATSRVQELQIAGIPDAWTGTFDLANNALGDRLLRCISDRDGSDLIKSGRGSGSWNGAGITSSTAATAAGHPPPPRWHRWGSAEASAIFTSFPAIFAGQSVDNTSVLVGYTRYGDANLDGTVG
jgi:hypothetical protein